MWERTTRIPLELKIKVSIFFSKDTDFHEFDIVAERGEKKQSIYFIPYNGNRILILIRISAVDFLKKSKRQITFIKRGFSDKFQKAWTAFVNHFQSSNLFLEPNTRLQRK